MPLKQKQLQLCKYGPESGSCHCSDSLDKEVWTAEIRTQVYLAIWLLKQWPGFTIYLLPPHTENKADYQELDLNDTILLKFCT